MAIEMLNADTITRTPVVRISDLILLQSCARPAIPSGLESRGEVGVMPKKQKKGGKGGSKAPPPAAAAASKAVVVSDEDEDVGAADLAQVRPIVRVQLVVRALT